MHALPRHTRAALAITCLAAACDGGSVDARRDGPSRAVLELRAPRSPRASPSATSPATSPAASPAILPATLVTAPDLFFDAGDVTVRYRVIGRPGRLTPVLMLHGYTDRLEMWSAPADSLARERRVIVPDLRGFGQSGWVGAGGYYHFPDYVADVAALVDALSPARLGVVAHSMGGSIAVYYAGAFPARVERLALLEGLGPPHNEPELAVQRMQTWLHGLRRLDRAPRPIASLEEATARLAEVHTLVPREALAARAAQLTRRDEAGRLCWAWDPLHRTTAPTPFSADGFKAFLRRITCPTLFVSGGPSGWHVPDEDERIACLASHERFELPDAGHMMHWTQPEALAERLAGFFGGR